MSLLNYLHRLKSGRYQARMRVPLDLVEMVGKKELWKSCGTSDPRTAKEVCAQIVAEWRAWLKELRVQRVMTPHDLQRIVYEFYREEVAFGQQGRKSLPTSSDVDAERRAVLIEAGNSTPAFDRLLDVAVLQGAADVMQNNRTSQMGELKKHLATNEIGLIEPLADEIIKRERFSVKKGSAEYRELCHRLQRAQLEALQRAAEIDQGKFDGKPTDELIAPPSGGVEVAIAAPGEGIMELYDQYCLENPGGITADTLTSNRKLVKLFAEFVGETSSITSITKAAVRDWKRALFAWPTKAAEIREFKGLAFRDVLEANKEAVKPTITPKTINKYLSAVGGFCEWLTSNGHIESNPLEGLYLKLDKDVKTVFPYTTEQLKLIFNSPVFTGALSDEEDHRPGNVHINDHRRWLPLIALFTGCRLGEIAQLYVDDVRQDRGQWIFHVTSETARNGDVQKRTKTKGSNRVIPVHPELVRLGFLKYHEAIKASGEMRLFPEIKPDARGQMSGRPSRWYGRYIASIGVKEDRSINFHSYRHGLVDALRRGGYMDDQFKCLIGHTGGTTTGRYGSLPEGELKTRVSMIETVSYPGLELSHLYV